MFHGLGDNARSFTDLAKKMMLPYTAVLVVEGQIPVPLIPNAYMYYPAFDGMFNPLPSPDVSAVIPRFRGLIASILSQGWKNTELHLFGWQHGGALALEIAYSVGKDPLSPPSSSTSIPATSSSSSSSSAPSTSGSSSASGAGSGLGATGKGAAGGGGGSGGGAGGKVSRLGSVTSICARLPSHPTKAVHYPTPCCYFTRDGPAEDSTQKAEHDVERAFSPTVIVRAEAGRGPDMPRSTDEWAGIMRFWGQVMGKPVAENMEGVYEVK